MSNYIEVMTIVEGKTEEIFINSLLQPYLSDKNIFMHATQISKPGQKGGDVRFGRVKKDIEIHLKQRHDTYITTLVDYYGTKEWPGLDEVPPQANPAQIAKIVNDATKSKIVALFPAHRAEYRFIPYMAIHEFEALLFSSGSVIAAKLGIHEKKVDLVLKECGEPEAINNSPQTAPSKRLDGWAKDGKFPKTTTGIAMAKAIGIRVMRKKCPLFNTWLETFEIIQGDHQ
jgi:hypothetical protein